VPAVPCVGEKPVIVGAGLELVTVKLALLCAEPPGAVTWMLPELAPFGTLTARVVELAVATVAALFGGNVTESWDGVALNPDPKTVTIVPTGPDVGVNEIIET